MSVGLCRSEYGHASMTSICTTCGADIVVGRFDGADDFCPSCAMELIKALERQTGDLSLDVVQLQREVDASNDSFEDPTLYVVVAERPARGRERKPRVRRFVVVAGSDSAARASVRDKLGDDRWTLRSDLAESGTVEMGAELGAA